MSASLLPSARPTQSLPLFPGQIASEVIHPDDIDVRFSGAFAATLPWLSD